MNAKNSDSDQWQDCQPGELNSMVKHLKSRQRIDTLKQAASVTAAFTLLIAVGFFYLNQSPAGADVRIYAGISCGDVVKFAKSYMNGDLDASMQNQMRQHLEECPYCQAQIDRMKSNPNREAAGETGLLEPAAGRTPAGMTRVDREKPTWLVVAAR